MDFFSSILFIDKKNWENDWILNLWVERKILTTSSHVFSLKLLSEKDIYNIYHSYFFYYTFVDIVKKNPFFCSHWALYYKCVELGATFNSLLLFSVCPRNYASNKQLLP
jgi:hypothetical protein